MTNLRQFVKSAAARVICHLSVDKMIGHHNGSAGRPLIICYHRVVQDFADASTRSMPSLLVSTAMFEKQLDWLARHYRMVSIDEILEYSAATDRSQRRKGRQLATITFDDGYADFYHNAFPILKRKGIPSSVFVVTDLVGTDKLQTHDELYLLVSQWLRNPVRLCSDDKPELLQKLDTILQQDPTPYAATRNVLASFTRPEVQDILSLMRTQVTLPAQSLEELLPLNWEQLRTLVRQDVTIGSHTISHALLPKNEQAVVESELRESRLTLERELGVAIKHLAYPDGQFDERIAGSVQTAGYSGAYAICSHQSTTHPQYTVPRRVLWQRACIDETGAFSPAVLSCLINGVFERASECSQDHSRS